jgi:nitrogen regulatory protein PII
MLKKIECFIQPSKLDVIRDALFRAGAEGLSVTDVRGVGRQRGYTTGEKPKKKVKLLPKTKLEIIVDEEMVEDIITLIKKLGRTGTIGAGKIFVVPVEDAIRISTEEVGKSAIY